MCGCSVSLQGLVNIYTRPNQIPGYASAPLPRLLPPLDITPSPLGHNTSTASPTLDDVDVCPDVAFLDNDASAGVVDGMHGVDDLSYLSQVQVLHEVIAKDCLRQQLLRSAS